MGVKTVLRQLEELLERKDLSALEIERGLKDLEKVRRRLETRDYERSSFNTNTFCVADRARDALVEVQFYASLGRRWSALLDAIGLAGIDRIVDLGPGLTPKIELGLYYSDFRGEVVAVDKDADALEQMRRFIELFAPKFRLSPIACDLLEDAIPAARLVTANHLIDDLVLEHWCRTRGLDRGAAYLEEQAFTALWRSILAARTTVIDELLPRLVHAFARLVLPGGALAIVQYPSYLERSLELEQISELCNELLDRVTGALIADGFERDFTTPARALSAPSDRFGAEACWLLRRAG